MPLDLIDELNSSSLKATGLQIRLSHDPAINYAFQQNAIPVVRELVVRNDAIAREDLTIRVRTEPPFATEVDLKLQSLEPEGEFQVAPLGLKLSPLFLNDVTERVLGSLVVEVIEKDVIIAQKSEPITLLAKNEWCGLVSLPEILAAFVLPNDPVVMSILSRSSAILADHTGRSALNGYQDKSRKRAWEQVAAIYKAIAELGIRYIAPPASFENTGQKIRFPADVVKQRFGTCLDLVLLFCACSEQAGLHPLVLMHEGHAYAGCWLEDRTLEEPAIDDLQRLRKLVELEVITVMETTDLTSEAPGTLQDSERNAQPHLTTNFPFRLALDIRRSRVSRILPLPIFGEGPKSDLPQPAGAAALAETEFGQRDFAEPIIAPTVMQRPLTRIDQWKSRLLDLSLRNRLLNFKPTKSTIPILSAAPESVEDGLAAKGELSVQPKPKSMGEGDPRNAKVLTEQQKTDGLTSYLKEELAQGRLRTGLDEGEHTRRLTELYRAARLAVEENGTNTLFAAVGVLEWRETEHSDRVLRAPLLLVPVELKRRSMLEGFVLRRLDEDIRLNITLMEMLRQQFQKEVPGLDPLPEDEKGINVSQIFQIFREAVRDLPGWEVKGEVWLGQFSFTKFLLWKDLNDRLDALAENRIVRHLVQESGHPYPNPPEEIQPAQLDDQFHPREIFCPRSADSSQLAAVMAAAAGHDFVLEGPPGTGKSQTITNIIAHCLANGKRVLFVAEKRAALDVVHRRLKEEGLEPFCLELHSNKSGKADVLAQFDQSLKFVAEGKGTTWEKRAADLEKVRALLNEYARALHRKYPSGLSAYECFDYLLPRQTEETVKFSAWQNIIETTAERLASARQAAGLLQERSGPLGNLTHHPLTLVRREEWSPTWAEETLEQAHAFSKIVETTTAASRELCQWLSFSRPGLTASELSHFDGLAESLLQSEPVNPAFVASVLTPRGGDNSSTMPWKQLAERLAGWVALLEERGKLRALLKDFDEVQLLQLDLERLKTQWESGANAWFLLKWIKTASVRRQLRRPRPNQSLPDAESVSRILSSAMRLKEVNALFDTSRDTLTGLLGSLWGNSAITSVTLERVRAWGELLHSRIMDCGGDDAAWLGRIQKIIPALFADASAALAPGGEASNRLEGWRRNYKDFIASLEALAAELCLDGDPLKAAPDYLAAVAQGLTGIIEAWPQLRFWTSWQQARHEGENLGLAPIIARLESAGENPPGLPDLFERSFRRALLFAIIEREKALCNFFGHEHEERIDQFRKLDDKLATLAREVIRARLASKIPGDQMENEFPKAELGLLRKEIAKKIRHIPVRQLLSRIPQLLPRLKPCVLMSPLSVAQYLEASHKNFDVVIFDEASQIPVWDAIGAIARGSQLIVVGDPRQLPPTNFFNRTDDEDEDALVEFEDLESILDELLTHGLRHKRLQWHYRSRHEGLIAFSNRQYYENNLLTFPSPNAGQGGVKFVHLPDARYDKGKSRTNSAEAGALVTDLVARLRDTSRVRRSYGVVTFSQAQQQLIENLLDEERRKYPEIEVHFGDTPPVEGEPVFVKNLESVQGDERDVIFFSIGYGFDESGRVSMNFGPLNREGGERRLNVAITRAKHEVVVFSGLRGDQIDLTRTRARGVRDLKHFLEYAERGPKTLAAATNPECTTDAGFEEMVAAAIRAHGYEVHHRVGCSGYRIDLAVLHPERPGEYLLGIECDGSTYEQAATARDRDKLRHLILEGLGWKIHRLWSSDWWHDGANQTRKLLELLDRTKRK